MFDAKNEDGISICIEVAAHAGLQAFAEASQKT